MTWIRRPGMAICLFAGMTMLSAGRAPADPARFDDFRYDGHAIEQAPPTATQYRNPILSGYYPDPSVTRVGDVYYLVNSSFAHFPGLPIFRSIDLVHWTQIGNAIDRPGQLDYSGLSTSRGAFAADISWHDGLFYIVNTCVDCKGNYVITARDPAGPWSDPVWLPFEGIDPSLYWDGDRAWIVNNRGPDEPPRYEGHRAIWIQEFDWRRLKMVGPAVQLINGGVDIAQKPVWIEGPHIFRKDGYHYLTAAEGGTEVRHSQVIFRARTLLGPYSPYPGNPILTQRDLPPDRAHPVTSAGHAKLIQTQAGDWWATFLATRPYAGNLYNIGRETFLLPVNWRDGWPHILERGQPIPLAAQRPPLPMGTPPKLATSGDFSYIDQFDGDRLGMEWIGIRTPHSPFYKLADGMLKLGSGTALGNLNGTPAFVGRRQQHAVATISTRMHYKPGKDGNRAGLAAVQSDRSFVFFGLARIAGQNRIALYSRDNSDADQLIASAPFATDGPVTLTMRIDGGTMAFDYEAGGRQHSLKAGFDASLLSTDRAGGFVGTVIGPYHYSPDARDEMATRRDDP